MRPAAVLVLLYPKDGAIRLLLTLRPQHMVSHRGQISFPGGAVEGNETFEQCALREAYEEVDLNPEGINLLGQLTPLHVPVSGFLVHPVIGVYEAAPVLSANPEEVERIWDAPLELLLDPASVLWRFERRREGEFLIPYLAHNEWMIWGATAMMLSELLTLLGWPGPGDPPPIESLPVISETDESSMDSGGVPD
jgi:8-oxo-dGTP pyrophosphatase MutT (NUDIX family)